MTGFDLPQGMMTVFVTGEQDVKTYPVALGNSVNLIDEENGRMYIKGRDASGMPRQTRIFEIKEITPVLGMPGDVVTRKEFDELKGVNVRCSVEDVGVGITLTDGDGNIIDANG